MKGRDERDSERGLLARSGTVLRDRAPGLWQGLPSTNSGKVIEALYLRGYLRSSRIETEHDAEGQPVSSLFHFTELENRRSHFSSARSRRARRKTRRLRDLDRLINMIRNDVFYLDTIAVRLSRGTHSQASTRFRAG